MANALTFEEIYNSAMIAIGDNQYARINEVKAMANMIYLNEINRCDDLYPLFWLLHCDDTQKSKVRAAITAISKAAQGSVTSTGHGFVSGDVVTLYGIEGMTELNFRTVVIVKTTADAYTMTDLDGTAINTTNLTTYTGGGYAHHRGVTLTDCNRVLKANWHGYNKGLDFMGLDRLEDEAAWMDVSVSRPQKCMHRKVFSATGGQLDYLLWYQAADAAYNLRVWTEKLISRLSATTDVPIGPPETGDAIIAGTIMRLGENKVEVEAGSLAWSSIYKIKLDAIRTFNRQWWQQFKQDERSGLFLA